jgi:hypothetical protein
MQSTNRRRQTGISGRIPITCKMLDTIAWPRHGKETLRLQDDRVEWVLIDVTSNYQLLGDPRGSSLCREIARGAIAQMGLHLVFFLHFTTGPDNTNNMMALAFGLPIIFLVIGGLLWIMANLNHNMMPMDQVMQMQG